MDLLVGMWTVLDAAWDDVEVALVQHDIAVALLNGERALEDDELLVLVVRMPVRGTDSLGHLEEVSVGLTDGSLRPVLVQFRHRGVQVDGAHASNQNSISALSTEKPAACSTSAGTWYHSPGPNVVVAAAMVSATSPW